MAVNLIAKGTCRKGKFQCPTLINVEEWTNFAGVVLKCKSRFMVFRQTDINVPQALLVSEKVMLQFEWSSILTSIFLFTCLPRAQVC